MMNCLKNFGLMLINAYRERYERDFAARYARIYNKARKYCA